MNILYFTYPLSAVLIFILVFGLGIFLIRKYQLGWRLFFIGAAGFIISQILHIPFNFLLLNPFLRNLSSSSLPEVLVFAITGLLLGLSAGLFEEFTRYGLFRWWAREARSWAKGLLLGSGWGGGEAILFAAIPILLSYLVMLVLKTNELPGLLPPDQMELVKQSSAAYWSIPWYDSLLGFVERAFAIPIQISLSLLVLQVFTRQQSRWLWIAIGWHTLVDGLVVFALSLWQGYSWLIYAIEALAGLFAIFSLLIIFRLKQPEPEPTPALVPPLAPGDASALPPVEVTSENLSESRYN
jgi:uncharacterized membrane protein YhfC